MASPLAPTYEGHIASTIDALILFEACLSGQLNHVPRRPHDRERQDLIKSGNVFIYEEHASGIKRWTDGVSWSPSRILGNFLIYRELERPFPPGEKKRALKKNRKPQQGVTKSESNSRSTGNWSNLDLNGSNGKDPERSLIGSLVDSYPFKNDGLVKKTISVTYQGVPHHLVSYYNVNDAMSGRLPTPSKNPQLRQLIPRTELLMHQTFRAPIDEVECGPGEDRYGVSGMYTTQVGMEYGQGSILQRAMSLPNYQHPLPIQYQSQQPPPHYTYQHAHQLPPPQHPPVQPPQNGYVASMAPGAPMTPGTSMPPGASPISYGQLSQGNYALETNRSLSYTQPSQGNYALDPNRQPYFMPPQRSASLAGIHDHGHYSSPRQIKGEPVEGVNGASQQFGLEENNGLDENEAPWSFDPIATGQTLDGPQENQYYPPNPPHNGSWPPQPPPPQN